MGQPAVTWPEEKRCSKCKHLKPAGQFYKNARSKDGLKSYCKRCVGAVNVQPEVKARRLAAQRARRTTPEGRAAARWEKLKYRYGLTREDYERILASQGGACAICERRSRKGENFSVDHDHSCCPGDVRTCGKCVRGLLCTNCNRRLLGLCLQEGKRGTERALKTARNLVRYLERGMADAGTERAA